VIEKQASIKLLYIMRHICNPSMAWLAIGVEKAKAEGEEQKKKRN